jgi:hypothetical protein
MKTANHPSKSNTTNIVQPSFIVNARDLFDSFDHRVNWRRVYCSYFQAVPSRKEITDIDCARVAKWIEAKLSDRILKKHSNEDFSRRKRKMIYDDLTYVLTGRLLIFLNVERDYIGIFFSENQEEAQSLLMQLKRFTRRSSAAQINLVIPGSEGFSLKEIKSKKPVIPLTKNYNDDLAPLHDALIKALKKEHSGGLVLFHGVPGTGKSTYIRFLISYVRKKIIFLSPRIAGNLDDPGFTKLLTENPNSVIIIEDAEDLLVSRNSNQNSGISMLLNLTDGLLGTSLGIQFICTFNTPVTNIDNALLRKGRLIALYEFGRLSPEKSRALLTNLGARDFMVTQPMTLADIYNASKPAFQLEAKRNPIGFNACVA